MQLKYRQALALSTTDHAGIVSWVAFWALYGEGFTSQTVTDIVTFGAAYMLVIIVEPLADLPLPRGDRHTHRTVAATPVNPRIVSLTVLTQPPQCRPSNVCCVIDVSFLDCRLVSAWAEVAQTQAVRDHEER